MGPKNSIIKKSRADIFVSKTTQDVKNEALKEAVDLVKTKTTLKNLWQQVDAFALNEDEIHDYIGKGGKVLNYLTRGQVGKILNDLYKGAWSMHVVEVEPRGAGYIAIVRITILADKKERSYEDVSFRTGNPDIAVTAAFKRAASFAIPAFLTFWSECEEKSCSCKGGLNEQ